MIVVVRVLGRRRLAIGRILFPALPCVPGEGSDRLSVDGPQRMRSDAAAKATQTFPPVLALRQAVASGAMAIGRGDAVFCRCFPAANAERTSTRMGP